jgi:uncharacterized protein YaeQ
MAVVVVAAAVVAARRRVDAGAEACERERMAAPRATVYKAQLNVTDIDRNHYADYPLTIACHPSETEERLMLRVLAFALNAREELAFGKGISEEDEPDLWAKDLTGAVLLWVEIGHPDDRAIMRACGKSEQVVIYATNANAAQWWGSLEHKLTRAKNLRVVAVSPESREALGKLAARSMDLAVTIQDGDVWVRTPSESVQVTLTELRAS